MDIKEIREKTGLSQRQFSEKNGIPVRTIQQWEQGRTCPPSYVTAMLESLNKDNMVCEAAANTYIDNLRIKPIHTWKVVIPEGFMNCEKIHPLNQRKVKSLIDILIKSESVKKIIIFGSSVSNQCHIGSDVDIFAETDDDINPINEALPFDYDYWNNFRVDSRLKDEIEKKGVLVYER